MSDLLTTLVPVIIAVFGSSGFWAFLSSKKDKHGEILESVKNLEETMLQISNKVERIKEANEEVEARNCRNRIVRFSDEIRAGVKHSKDMYDHIIIDCDEYEAYCEAHEGFKNSIAVISIKKIKDNYEKENFL